MNLIMWLREPGRRGLLLARLYSEDSADALNALEEMRDRGWLKDRSLRGADLREANLPGADLKKVDWEEVRLEQANLAGADLSEGRLSGADFSHATLTDTNFHGAGLQEATFLRADLQGADFSDADLRDADFIRAEVTVESLRQASMLRGCTLPDGELYDGRFNLRGDIEQADAELYDVDDAEEMAGFYGVSEEQYSDGQIDAPPMPELPEVEEDDEPEEIGFGNFMRYALMAFGDPDRVEKVRDALDNRRSARVAGAWWLAILVLVPSFIVRIILLISYGNPLYAFWPSTLNPRGIAEGVRFVVLVIVLILAGRSGTQPARQGTVSRGVALVLAFVATGYIPEAGVVSLIAIYMFVATTAPILVGRSSRITLFWIAIAIAMRSIVVPFDALLPGVLIYSNSTNLLYALYNILILFSAAFLVFYAIQHVLKRHLLIQLGKSRNSDLIGWGLLMVYVAGIGFMIWAIVPVVF